MFALRRLPCDTDESLRCPLFRRAYAIERGDPLPSTVDGSEARLHKLLQAAREGSSEALGKLMEGFRPYLLLIAYQEMDSDLCAKAGPSDLVQESFLEAQRDIRNFQGAGQDELMAWLRQILLHNLADFARRYREAGARRVALEQRLDDSAVPALRQQLVTDVPSPSTQAMANEQVVALIKLLNRLPEDYRQAIVLRHQQHLSFTEIGAALGRSAEAARKLWARAIEAMQEHMRPPS